VHSENGKELIFEMHDSSVEFGYQHQEEDMKILKELTLQVKTKN
jgi:hypothetical protein